MSDNDPSLRPPLPPFGLDAARWQRLRVRAFGACMLVLVVIAFHRLTRRGSEAPPRGETVIYAVQSANEGCDGSLPVSNAPAFFVERDDPNGARLLFPCGELATCRTLAAAPALAMVRPTVPPPGRPVATDGYLLAPAPLGDPTERTVRHGEGCRRMRHIAELDGGAYTLELRLADVECSAASTHLPCAHRRTYELVRTD
ncbi:MAG: hypothetical protein AAF938_09345 [Myxococcota bacterium]